MCNMLKCKFAEDSNDPSPQYLSGPFHNRQKLLCNVRQKYTCQAHKAKMTIETQCESVTAASKAGASYCKR